MHVDLVARKEWIEREKGKREGGIPCKKGERGEKLRRKGKGENEKLICWS